MRTRCRNLFRLVLLVILAAAAWCVFDHRDGPIERYVSVERSIKIWPDYSGTVIPPNIAPLNFLIKESGGRYCVKIYSKDGRVIEVFSKTGSIIIPAGRWHQLLNMNRGRELYFDIFVKTQNSRWSRFPTITNKIASEDIDNFLVYRKIYPGHSKWGQMGIYQRNLETCDESAILENRFFENGCVNCHSFRRNLPDKMLIDIRSTKYGVSALLIESETITKIGRKLGFTTWHPSGRLIVCSINKPRLFFHSSRSYVQDILEVDSGLIYYMLDSRTMETSPSICKKDRLETFPEWSPDGRWLYFSSAPKWWKDENEIKHDKIMYDLVRVSYDVNTGQWGPVETVLSAAETGLSIIQPRVSPDGRWLLACMCTYGTWVTHNMTSDLYMIDIEAAKRTGRYEYRRLDINSDRSESWHSWSSNSRWIVFSSKMDYDIFTKPYFSYIDNEGRVYKPLLLPQKDPRFYDFCLDSFLVPEFITAPVSKTSEKLARIVRGRETLTVEMPVTMATPVTGKSFGTKDKELWRE
ncbi:MAG: hypothetical protein ABIG61_15260 [Planctomycetota bacterium]